jgi:hypothetical protein
MMDVRIPPAIDAEGLTAGNLDDCKLFKRSRRLDNGIDR